MACHNPIPAYLNTDGSVNFANRKESMGRFGLLTLRCGMCIGCKADHAREWSIRCYHESQLHEDACFVTLTYKDECLPPHGTLNPSDLRNWFKRLRKLVAPKRIRYFACGEYGEKKGRPHYHICLFGFQPALRIPVAKSSKGNLLFASPEFDQTWTMGHANWAHFETAAARYTAHYTADKIKGYKLDEIDPESGLKPYEVLDETTGDIWSLVPEFQRSSNKPGLGIKWLEKNWREIFPADTVVMDGREYPVPKAYWNWLRENKPDMAAIVREKRIKEIKDIPYEPGVRQMQRNKARSARLNQLVRPTHGERR